MELRGRPISDKTYRHSQSWFREVVVEVEGNKLRYEVEHNAYVSQSWGRAELWDGAKWNLVHAIPGEALQTYGRTSYTSKSAEQDAFDEDLAELERVALAVVLLGGPARALRTPSVEARYPHAARGSPTPRAQPSPSHAGPRRHSYMQHRRSAPRGAPRPPLLRGGRRAVGHRRRLKLLRTLLGSLGKTARRPAKKDLGGAAELLLVVLVGAAIGLALALGYVPEAL